MKNKLGLFGLIALLAIIGFAATGCEQPTNEVTPVGVDRTALGNAITAAQALLYGVVASADGTSITSGWWAPQAAIDAFTAAITIAQGVHGNANATQAEVNTAASNLSTAQATFNAARQPGMYTPATADRTALGNAITAAQILIAGTAISSDGTDVATTAYWATQAAHAAFSSAVSAAQGVYGNAAATQAEVTAAVSDLATAQTTFIASRALGTSVTAVDKTALGSAIAAAQALLAETVASEDGTGVTSGYWAPQAAIDAFTSAIAIAQGVHGNANATQAEVNTAASNLATAQATFNTARQPGTYTPTAADRTALGNAIAAAQVLIAETATSADGTDVATTAYWATQAAHADFASAVSAAQDVYGNTVTTQAEVDTAASTLQTARATFMAARALGTSATAVDRTTLGGAIANANTLLASTTVSTDGIDVAITAFWTSVTIRTTFENAISAAQSVYGNNGATQATVDGAVSTLTSAHTVFYAARQPGAAIVLTALNNALAAANTLINNTEIATNANNVHPNVFWTTTAVRTTFQNAINAAQGVHDAPANMAAVNAAVSSLTSAQATFSTARQPGAVIVLTALNDVLVAANALINNTEIATNANNVHPNAFWTTTAVRTTFQNAINAAQGVHDAPANMAAVNAAVSSLTSAQATFNTARQPGAAIVLTALNNALTAANTLLNGTEISENGGDVLPALFWTTATVRTTFQNAIDAAQGVHDAPANMAEVNNAVSNLTSAQTTFNTARQPGTAGGEGGFTIGFMPGITTDADIQGPTVSLGARPEDTPTITLLDPERFSSIVWRIGGTPVPPAAVSNNGATLTLGSHVHNNDIATHRVTVEVVIGGVIHSRVIVFDVTL